MNDPHSTAFFTGHRDLPEDLYNDIYEKVYFIIKTLYIAAGYRDFVAGGAVGFDTLAAKAVLRLRESAKDARLHIIVPCKGQDKYFSPQQKQEYAKILESADSVEVLYEHYVRGCMHARNKKMADRSSVCVAYCTKDTGGTAYTVSYARKKGIEIIYV